MKDYEIELVRGNSPTINVTVTDDEGTVVNLTGYTMKMSVKYQAEDTDANALIGPLTATIANPASGIGVFSLTPTNTDIGAGDYVYDIKIENAGGTQFHTVVGPSKFTILENVTKG